MKPPAIGFLRRDVSGVSQPWHETQIRSLATRLGYDLRKTVVFGPETDQPMTRLRTVVGRTQAQAVVIPSLDHFDGAVPAALLEVVEVVTVAPECTYARSSLGEVDASNGVRET